MDTLFPNIKRALYKTFTEEEKIPRTNNSDGIGSSTPHNNGEPKSDYDLQRQKLDDQEVQLRQSLDRIAKEREQLNKKYNMPMNEELHYTLMSW